MSDYPHERMGPPPIPPRPPVYRQPVQQRQYYAHETAESPAWRVPYQETEVLISTVDATPTHTHTPTTYTETNISRSSSTRRPPETHAVDSSYRTSFVETTEPEKRHPTHNVAIEGRYNTEEGRHNTETEQVSDRMYEDLAQVGWGGMTFYDTSRPSDWKPPVPQENIHTDRDNSGLRTIKKDYEPEYEKISMDYYDDFTPTFTPASASSQSYPLEKKPIPPAPPTTDYNTSRPRVPHFSVSDPFPISVEQERYASDLSNLRESQFPEPVNLGLDGSDTLWQPQSRSYSSYRRTPRRANEQCNEVKFDSKGLPSLSGLLGPASGQSPQPNRGSFYDNDNRFYPSNQNQSNVSLLSTHSDNVTPSSRYSSDVHRTPSFASIRPDNDSRPQSAAYGQPPCDQKGGIPPPPTRYSSQRVSDKLGQVLQDKKMEYVVGEINRKDDLHKRMLEESRRWGY
ncbi:hypothetical protein ABW20_dc0100954 [Dactylellina cionopaga]|nr:hypothetical protein ABW20_dc0100954 [Dactylellina cionopaga]